MPYKEKTVSEISFKMMKNFQQTFEIFFCQATRPSSAGLIGNLKTVTDEKLTDFVPG